ncbi:hypothetical protein SBY92_002848 [Candida maltosa Xu316]
MAQQITYQANQIEEIYNRVKEGYELKKKTQPQSRYLISLAGVPGAGKTTFSNKISEKLSKLAKIVVLPQDGFHLYRSELQQMTNPEEAVRRRGAPFTFNPKAFLALVSQLPDRSVRLEAPSFDHKLKDPKENDIIIDTDVEIVIVEGNYVSLKDEYWNEIGNFMDDTWFISTPEALVRERIIRRHIDAGIAANEQEAIERADGSDMVNAHYIIANSEPTNVLILSD